MPHNSMHDLVKGTLKVLLIVLVNTGAFSECWTHSELMQSSTTRDTKKKFLAGDLRGETWTSKA